MLLILKLKGTTLYVIYINETVEIYFDEYFYIIKNLSISNIIFRGRM